MARIRKASFEKFESISENSNYVRLTHSMLQSLAWKELPPDAVSVYLHLKAKYKFKSSTGEHNAHNLEMTYKEAAALHIPKKKFTKAIDKLLEVGLLDLVEHRPYSKLCNIYGLSTRWHKYGSPDFKEQKRPVIKGRTRCKDCV